MNANNKPNQFRSLIAASGQVTVPPPAPLQISAAAAVPKVRKAGKRAAPDYVQVGVYIPKALHNRAKVALIQEGQDRDFSELVADLLSRYVSSRPTA